MDRTFIQEQIDATKVLIVAYQNAVTALVAGAVESYTLDTGQSRQTVTKLDVNKLNTAIDGLYNRYVTLSARLNGSGTVNVRPCF